MRIVDLIENKKQGKKHTKEEIDFLIKSLMDGSAHDYQISAWLMAVYFKGLTEEQVMDALITEDVDFVDLETDEEQIIIYGQPQDLFKIKSAITNVDANIEFTLDEISLLPKDRITLEGESLDEFNKLVTMLDEVDDVQNVYHNVEL